LNQHFDGAEATRGVRQVVEAELTKRMKAFKKWFENHRHILALSFVSHKYARCELDRGDRRRQQCFSTVEARRIT
jgi:hypothetical protein